MKTFKLIISTPTGNKYENDKVTMVTADILEGRIGVMANHSPLVSSLKISILKILLATKDEIIIAINGGIFNVTGNEIVVLTTNFSTGEEVNIKSINDELRNIEHQMQSDIKEAEAKSLEKRHQYASLKKNLFEMES